jgi:hypothetical protein
VDPVPDPLPLRKPAAPGIEAEISWSVARSCDHQTTEAVCSTGEQNYGLRDIQRIRSLKISTAIKINIFFTHLAAGRKQVLSHFYNTFHIPHTISARESRVQTHVQNTLYCHSDCVVTYQEMIRILSSFDEMA